jgi:endonuclease/exonuclease/phosphatase family metal-dependent hydrolase
MPITWATASVLPSFFCNPWLKDCAMTTHFRRICGLAFLALLPCLLLLGCAPPATSPAPPPDSYLFCFWNVENLFDDLDDGRTGADKVLDVWFAQNAADRQLKYAHISEALLKLNDGRGPDILAVVEVESLRAAELLRDALNQRLADESLHYKHVLMKEVNGGRHIAPAILTRLPVEGYRTRLLGSHLRILESHIIINDHALVVIASHWTSQVSDAHGDRRDKYADQICGAVRGMYKSNPLAKVLICGDFNDTPDSDSVVKHLHAVGDRDKVRTSRGELWLYDLMGDKDPNDGYGTHNYHNKWLIFDQIVVTPGLLEAPGWIVLPDTLKVINTLVQPHDRHRRPWRFGNPHDRYERGYSDHFPVTVRFKVAGS